MNYQKIYLQMKKFIKEHNGIAMVTIIYIAMHRKEVF